MMFTFSNCGRLWRSASALSRAGLVLFFGCGISGVFQIFPVPAAMAQAQEAENSPSGLEKPVITIPEAPDLKATGERGDTTFVTRLQLAKQLVDWFNLPTWPVHDFPLFVDIERDNEHYAVIDSVHRHHLLFAYQPAEQQGVFAPKQPATQLDLWLAVGKMLAPKNLMDAKEAQKILADFDNVDSVPPYHHKRLAQLALDGVLTPEENSPLQPDKYLQPGDLDKIADKLQISQRIIKQREMEAALSQEPEGKIPGSVTLTFTPSQAITQDKLHAGNTLHFQTLSDVEFRDPTRDNQLTTLPVGSSLTGHVDLENIAEQLYHLVFDYARSAQDGRKYGMNAAFTLSWKNAFKSVPNLLLTGDELSVTTQMLNEAPGESVVNENNKLVDPEEPTSITEEVF